MNGASKSTSCVVELPSLGLLAASLATSEATDTVILFSSLIVAVGVTTRVYISSLPLKAPFEPLVTVISSAVKPVTL